MEEIRSTQILDPLSVRVAIFTNEDERLAFIQFDTLIVRWAQAQAIRSKIEEKYGFPSTGIMVFATHNHAGPAIANFGKIKRDDAYVESIIGIAVDTFGSAFSSIVECEIGCGYDTVLDLAFNRRIVMSDGTVRTNATLLDTDARYTEGPVDPGLDVIVIRNQAGTFLGALVNFAIHPVHGGHEDYFSAGFPGILEGELKKRGIPGTLFMNGACGNVSGRNPATRAYTTMHEVGSRLAEKSWNLIERMTYSSPSCLKTVMKTVELPYREPAEWELNGWIRGAQRIGNPSWYTETIPGLMARIKTRRVQPAEVQVFFLGNLAYVGIPGEYFSEHGLRIKEACHPLRVIIVGYANGMVGYLPTVEAFKRGGYEATFAPWSRMAPEAGDLLADAVISLIDREKSKLTSMPTTVVDNNLVNQG